MEGYSVGVVLCFVGFGPPFLRFVPPHRSCTHLLIDKAGYSTAPRRGAHANIRGRSPTLRMTRTFRPASRGQAALVAGAVGGGSLTNRDAEATAPSESEGLTSVVSPDIASPCRRMLEDMTIHQFDASMRRGYERQVREFTQFPACPTIGRSPRIGDDPPSPSPHHRTRRRPRPRRLTLDDETSPYR